MITPLQTIGNINKEKYEFHIPAYQRGYRWGTKQVEALLEDIWERQTVYYLQPLMLKKIEENKYNVIDGQQRLTTVYLILKYFKSNNLLEDKDIAFTLTYSTRNDLTDLLENIENKENIKCKNPDIYCIVNAYKCIKKYFENLSDKDEKEEFTAKFLNKTKFIWYEKDDISSEQESFDHLNGGKIPLSSAELLKGALWGNLPDDDKKLLGTEWDNIEHFLSKQEIWGFISKDINKKQCRIELLFEIYLKNKTPKLYNNYLAFKDISPWIYDGIMEHIGKNTEKYLELWNTIKSYARQIEYWFYDRTCYHYIGFLMYMDCDIKKVFEEIVNFNKDEQKRKLKKKIQDLLGNKHICQSVFTKPIDDKVALSNTTDIEPLSYKGNKEELKLLLLLFNVLTCLNDKNEHYFPFYSYTNIEQITSWSLEHIFAQHSEELKPRDRVALLLEQNKDEKFTLLTKEEENALEDLKNKLELSEQNLMYLEKIENEKEQLLAGTNITKEKHLICNLALLDKTSNTKLSNKLFYDKVDVIKELCKDEKKFIPPATINVFLKFYSSKVKNFYKWDEEDRNQYNKALVNTLNEFLPKQGEKNV